jgi:hypothetical protein
MRLLFGKWYIGIKILNRTTRYRMPDDLYMGIGIGGRKAIDRLRGRA